MLLFSTDKDELAKHQFCRNLYAWLPRVGPYHPVFFDLQNKASKSLKQVLYELAQAIAHELNRLCPDIGDDPERTFQHDWLPNILDRLPNGDVLVLCFDEFDVLADPKSGDAKSTLFPYMRDLVAANHQKLKFVFVIGRNLDDLDTTTLSLFKVTKTIRVSFLNPDETG